MLLEWSKKVVYGWIDLKSIFKKVVSIAVEDGVTFKGEITVANIKEGAEYEGLRINIPVEIVHLIDRNVNRIIFFTFFIIIGCNTWSS